MRQLWHRLVPPAPEQVVRDCARQVQTDLRRIFGPRAELDDLTQTVFVEVLRALPGFIGRSRLETWVRRITWNVAYQEMRQGYRRARWETREEIEAVAPAAHDPEHRVRLARLYDALDALSPKHRVVVVLHDIEGYTLKEIATALGRPLQTVASQLHSGRALLGVAFAGEHDEASTTVPSSRKRDES